MVAVNERFRGPGARFDSESADSDRHCRALSVSAQDPQITRYWGDAVRRRRFGGNDADDDRGARRLVPEIDELERLLELEAADMGDGRLQIVALLAGDPQLVALDRGLDLE